MFLNYLYNYLYSWSIWFIYLFIFKLFGRGYFKINIYLIDYSQKLFNKLLLSHLTFTLIEDVEGMRKYIKKIFL